MAALSMRNMRLVPVVARDSREDGGGWEICGDAHGEGGRIAGGDSRRGRAVRAAGFAADIAGGDSCRAGCSRRGKSTLTL
jgi:hypothetical protein